MSSEQNWREFDGRAGQGETVVPSGTGGKRLEAQENFAEGRSRGGQIPKVQIGTGTEGYKEIGKVQIGTETETGTGTEGYKEIGKKSGLRTTDETGGERAEREGIPIDESKFRNRS